MSSKHLNGPDTEAPDYWPGACRRLRRADRVMGTLIKRAGGSTLRPRRDAFFSLARSIVGQQISVLAAESVWRKLGGHLGAVTPKAVAAADEESLRACGLSRQKVRYLTSLAGHFLDGSLELEAWPALDDEEVIARLCRVDGIGRWTAEMFLIFHLTRPDVLPVADLGLQKAIGRHYGNGAKPTPAEMRAIAEPWRPWRSVATWYLWRSLDAVPVEY